MVNSKRILKLQQSIKTPLLIKKKENLLYLTGRSFDLRAEEIFLVKPSSVPLRGTPSPRGGRADVVGFGSGLEQIDWVKKSDQLKNIGKYLKGAKQLDIEYKFTYGEGAYLKKKLKVVKIK